jgi:hypothetical protein
MNAARRTKGASWRASLADAVPPPAGILNTVMDEQRPRLQVQQSGTSPGAPA